MDTEQVQEEVSSDRVKSIITQAVARVLAPESLAIDRDLSIAEVRAEERLGAVQPGDFILVNTPGRVYEYIRHITRHKFDHIAAVVNNNQVLHIGPSKVRLLPTARLLVPTRNPVVLRPKLTSKERDAFVKELEDLVGKDYDLVRAYSVIAKLTLEKYLGIKLPGLKNQGSEGSEAFICSEALLQALKKVSPACKDAIENSKLHHHSIGAASITDFMMLHKAYPSIFSRIPLPACDESKPLSGPNKPTRHRLEDLHLLKTAVVLTRSSIIQVIPFAFQLRVKDFLESLEQLLDHNEVPIFFVQIALLYLIYKRYPLPLLFSFFPRARL